MTPFLEANSMAVTKKSPYTPFRLNGTSIPLAKSGIKVIDGKKLAAQAEIKKGLQEVATSKIQKSH
jgi:hypothetical protein